MEHPATAFERKAISRRFVAGEATFGVPTEPVLPSPGWCDETSERLLQPLAANVPAGWTMQPRAMASGDRTAGMPSARHRVPY
jgi:hypothetical protein